jgi:hypothetical protein
LFQKSISQYHRTINYIIHFKNHLFRKYHYNIHYQVQELQDGLRRIEAEIARAESQKEELRRRAGKKDHTDETEGAAEDGGENIDILDDGGVATMMLLMN